MNISLHTFLVVCPLVFLAGLVDAIGGGGGLISLPAFLIAGLPPHAAIATNKISSPFGTALATYRFAKAKLINLKLAAPAVVAAICGSFIGAQISGALGLHGEAFQILHVPEFSLVPSRSGTHSFLCINGNPSGICISRIKQEII